MAQSYDVVVVGAGVNGLVAAASLAKAGKSVLVVERRDTVGGLHVTEEFAPGFRASVGPDLLGFVHPQMMQELALDRHGLAVTGLDPAVFLPLDGDSLTIWRDREKTVSEIARRSKADAEAYPRFADLVGRLTRYMAPILSERAPRPHSRERGDVFELLRLGWRLRRLGSDVTHQGIRVLPLCMKDWLADWFEDEALKACLTAPALTGVSVGPRSNGTATLFLYHQLGAEGSPLAPQTLPRGGTGSISQAMARAAEAFGARIRTGARVVRCLTHEGRVKGVVLENGEEIASRMVASSAPPNVTFLGLADLNYLGPDFLKRVHRIRYRGVTAKLNLALAELPDFKCKPGKEPAAHHRGIIQIGPDLDYLERAHDDAKYRRPSARPFLRMVIPSIADPSLAPPGKHVLSVTMQYAPYRLDEGTWPDLRDALADAIIATIAEHAPNLPGAVLHRQMLTPYDYEAIYGAPEGSLHDGELALDQLLFMRPMAEWAWYRTPVPGLYMCGSSTHPGSGVTGGSGWNASRQILEDWSRGTLPA